MVAGEAQGVVCGGCAFESADPAGLTEACGVNTYSQVTLSAVSGEPAGPAVSAESAESAGLPESPLTLETPEAR